MSNGINTRQNEKKSIAMLAAQRQLYEDVSFFDYLNITLSVVLPLLFSILQNIGVSWVKHLSYGLTLIMIFVSIYISKYEKEKKNTAASIQLIFDVYVFQMLWDKKLFGEKKDLSEVIAKKSKKILDDVKCEKALHNWYTTTIDKMPLEKGILFCQRENYHWDVGLRKRYRTISIALLAIAMIIVIALGAINQETVIELWLRIIFLIPMLRWLANTVSGLNDDIKRLNQMDNIINSDHEKNMEELQSIQKCITDHRKACVKIPSFIYKVFKENDEDQEHRRADLS